ncbi:hypothetical protein [Massilia sp. TN1-12]|uniref:hypothetical protein n=1 Tax=Massilia paldalensis TaxID=3377675 RepID=UPI00384B4335
MGLTKDEADTEPPAKSVKPRHSIEITKLEELAASDGLRLRFEDWAGKRPFDLKRQSDGYVNIETSYAWMGWLGAYAAIG